MAESDRRVELVGKSDEGHEAGRVGLGLMIGLLAGHRALLAAATGRGTFETSLGSFVLIVLVSVGGLLFLGNLYDRFTAQAARTADADASLSNDDDESESTDDHLDNTKIHQEEGPESRPSR